MERDQIVQRLQMLRGDAFRLLHKAERSRRSEAYKELCRSVYGKDIAALNAAILIVSAPFPSSDRGGS